MFLVLLGTICCVNATRSILHHKSFGGASRLYQGQQQQQQQQLNGLFELPRGGAQEELTLDEKVHAAMRKLGLDPSEDEDVTEEPAASETATADETATATENGYETTDVVEEQQQQQQPEAEECAHGVCAMPVSEETVSEPIEESEPVLETQSVSKGDVPMDVNAVATKIASEMQVDRSLAMAALGATSELLDDSTRRYNEEAAKDMIQQELTMINQIHDDMEEVKQLVEEGFDPFLSRRALAFAELNIDDARAILLADQMDEEEEEQAEAQEQQRQYDQQQQQQLEQEQEQAERDEEAARPKPQEMKTVTVESNFDPTKVDMPASELPKLPRPTAAQSKNPMGKPAKKSDVVFEATAATLHELVLESPVPVLLDIYADWCGPCKVLGPALEEMAIKSGGVFRLVKVNSDNEKAISAALEITSLPTVFGIKDGKILNSFQGMPRSEDVIKNFMMGLLMPGAKFKPPLTVPEEKKFAELSSKLSKTAGAASFPFSLRERLQDKVGAKLDELTKLSGDLVDAEESATILRSLLSNVIKDPLDMKFRSVNLANKVIAAKITKYLPCIAILKSVGFVKVSGTSGENTMMLASGKKIVNVAPLTVARDCIDKWIDNSRYDIAKASRKRKDEEERERLHAAGAFDVEEEDEVDEPEEEVDTNACSLKLRLEGRKKVHDVVLQADEPLKAILKALKVSVDDDDDEVQITCIAKRIVIKSLQDKRMNMSLRELGLLPAASIVVSVGTSAKKEPATSNLSQRASDKKKKKGSHTMQSVGIYSKDDNNKSNLIDGGGGTVYEYDDTDDEADEKEVEGDEKEAEGDEKEVDEDEDADQDEDEDADSSDESGSSESE
jgi:thiol-disulfide isomerase/thioredoxin